MKTADFDYHLLEEMIALYPLSERETSRLMVVDRKTGRTEHKLFYELPELLRRGDLLVLNDTKVIPARIFGKRDDGKEVDVLLVERINSALWKCLLRNPKQGMRINFQKGLTGKLKKDGKSTWVIQFNWGVDSYIEEFGKMPLPPYIRREVGEEDRKFYQTVYAEKTGAIAAPTAGLHFSIPLLGEIREREIDVQCITLHVGVGTFRPVKSEVIEEHDMHPEYREISYETAFSINRAKSEGRRVVAVGTTVVRALESAVDNSGRLRAESGYTDLFIHPGFDFRIVDALVTNFHLPRSTLLMMISAFAGKEKILAAYEEAKREGYRFLSYGDAMLIL